MGIFIAFIRGINVGGHRKLPMKQLRQALTEQGLDNVSTYIQTGNVIFSSTIVNQIELTKKIKNVILEHFGFEVGVIVKSTMQLQKLFDECPFTPIKKQSSYFIMLSNEPLSELRNQALMKSYVNEEFHIVGDCIYFFTEKGYGKAKFNLSYFENKLKVFATARNYKTMLKMIVLAKEMAK